MLTVAGVRAKTGVEQRRAVLECSCDCGGSFHASKAVLTYGSATNCGCKPGASQRVNLVGKRFGRLVVLHLVRDSKRKRSNGDKLWKCRCDCGQRLGVFSSPLRQGRVKSCGCLKRENAVANGKALRDRLRVPFASGIRKVSLRRYKHAAKLRELPWELTETQFEALLLSDCFYCGSPPKTHESKYGKHSARMGGVDRLNSAQGYLFENCVPCCSTCNWAKSETSKEEFLAWVSTVYEHQKKQKPSLEGMGKI